MSLDGIQKHGKVHLPNNVPPLDNTQGDTSTQGTGITVGNGSIGQTGATPPAGQNYGSTGTPEFAAVLASLASFMPHLSDDDIDVLLAEATMNLKKLEAQSDNNQVTMQSDSKRNALELKEEKLKEAQKKIEDAIYKTEHESIWDKIKIAFEAIASVLSIIVGAILCATGAGAAVGALMIAAGVVGLVMTIDAIVRETTGLGIAGNIDKMVHPNDPSSWAKADMGFEIGMAVLGICLAVAGIVTGIGAVGAVDDVVELADVGTSIGSDAAQAEKVADSATETANQAQVVAKTAENVGNAVNVTTTVATTAGDTYYGVMNYESANDNAAAKDLQADAKRMEAIMQALDGLIQIAMMHLKSHMQAWDGALESITSAMDHRNESIIRAKI